MGIKHRFRRTLGRLFEWATRDDYPVPEPVNSKYSSMNSIIGRGSKVQSLDDISRGLNITVFRATGGQVIQSHQYDPRTDRTVVNLYVVHDSDDLGAELGQIITRENLSR